jgi:hypothetical protein
VNAPISEQAERSRSDEERLSVEKVGKRPAAAGIACDEQTPAVPIPQDKTKVPDKVVAAGVAPTAVSSDHLVAAIRRLELAVQVTVESDDKVIGLLERRSGFVGRRKRRRLSVALQRPDPQRCLVLTKGLSGGSRGNALILKNRVPRFVTISTPGCN